MCLRLTPSLRSGREVRASSWRVGRRSSLRSGAANTPHLAQRSLLAGAPLPPYPRGSFVAATAGGFRFGASRVLALRAAECSLAPVAFSLSVFGSPSECTENVAPCSVGFYPRCRSLPSFVGWCLSALPRVLLLCVGLFAPDGARRNARLLRRGPRPALKSLGGSPAPSRFPRSLRSRPCDGAQGQGRAVSVATLRAFFFGSRLAGIPAPCSLRSRRQGDCGRRCPSALLYGRGRRYRVRPLPFVALAVLSPLLAPCRPASSLRSSAGAVLPAQALSLVLRFFKIEIHFRRVLSSIARASKTSSISKNRPPDGYIRYACVRSGALPPHTPGRGARATARCFSWYVSAGFAVAYAVRDTRFMPSGFALGAYKI